MPRQKLTRPVAPGAGFLAAPPPAARDRTWEKKNPTASYRIPAPLRDQITLLAQDNRITTSDLVAYLLAYALADVQSGRLQLNPRLKEGRFTL